MLTVKVGFQPLEDALAQFSLPNEHPDLLPIVNKWLTLLAKIPFKFMIQWQKFNINDYANGTLYQVWSREENQYKQICGNTYDVTILQRLDAKNKLYQVRPLSIVDILTGWYRQVSESLVAIGFILDDPEQDDFELFGLKSEHVLIGQSGFRKSINESSGIKFVLAYCDPSNCKEVFVNIPLRPLHQTEEWLNVFGQVPANSISFNLPCRKEILKEVKIGSEETNDHVVRRVNFEPGLTNPNNDVVRVGLANQFILKNCLS